MDHLPKNIHRSVLKNAMSQIGGRLFLSAARLIVASIIVRTAGAERFGEYSLLMSLLAIAEWLVDFGLTEISVRNICQVPESRERTLSLLFLIRLAQGACAFLVLLTILYGMDYSSDLIRAGIVGGAGLFFYAGVLVYRTLFRVSMRMELDVLGEAFGVLLSIPLTWYACRLQAPLETLIACYMSSRLFFFLSVWAFGCRVFKPNFSGIRGRQLLIAFKEAVPLGIAGLLVCVYDNLAPIILADLAGNEAVAYYSSAVRFVFPIVVIIQSINGAFYPVLASYWQKSMSAFASTQQAALDSSVLVAAALFCILNAGAEFLMGLIGLPLMESSGILRLMSWVVIARAITTSMSPLIIIAGAQQKMLWLAVLSVISQFGALIWLIPEYGAQGAAMTYLIMELVISLGPIVVISQYLTGISLNWRIPVRTILAAVLALQICSIAGLNGTFAGSLASIMLYAVLALLLRAVSPAKLHKIALHLKARRIAAADADCDT